VDPQAVADAIVWRLSGLAVDAQTARAQAPHRLRVRTRGVVAVGHGRPRAVAL
jgi:hypothetical protein